MWKYFLADKDGHPANFEPYKLSDKTKYAISTTSSPQIFGVFKTATVSVAGTVIISTPPNGGSIVLTDLIVSAEKKAGGTVTIRFTDGVNTETLLTESVNDAPFVIAHSFLGKHEGWQDARLELVTVANVVASVSLGYYKIQQGTNYADWNSLR